MLAGDANVGLASRGGIAQRGFAAEVESVAVVSGTLGVVEDGLIAEGHTKDLTQDLSGLAGREGKRDGEGQDEPQHIGRTVNAGQVNARSIGSGRGQLSGPKVVCPILVAQLELGEAQLLQQFFVPLQGLLLLQVVRAAVARALIDRGVGALFPAVEGAVAVGTPIAGGVGEAKARSELRQEATDFATQLAGLATIVEVEELRGCAAVSTATGRRGGGDGGRLCQGSQGIDVEVAIVGMLLAKVAAGLRLRLPPGENLFEFVDELLQFLAGKFLAEPKHQSWYLAHGGDSLRDLAGSCKVGLERESPPPFLLAVKSRRSSTPKAKRGKPPCLSHRPRLIAAGGRRQKRQHSPEIQQIIALRKESF